MREDLVDVSSKLDSEIDKKSMTHDSTTTGKRFRKHSGALSGMRNIIVGMEPIGKLSVYYCIILLLMKRYAECEKAIA